MTSRLLRLALLALPTVVSAWLAPIRAGAYVYWANGSQSGGLGRRELDGGGPTVGVTTNGAACGVAVDGTYLYWTDTGGSVGRVPLGGSPSEPNFVSLPMTPCQLSVDGADVYWTDTGSDTVGRANLDGSSPTANFASSEGTPGGVASDGVHVYWTDTTDGTIGIVGVNGSGVNQNFITGLASPKGITVDAGHIYWAAGTSIGRANLAGTGVNKTFITGTSGACGVAVNGTHIYWTNQSGNAIGRANLSGTSPDQSFITDGVSAPCGIALDAGVSPTTTTTSSTVPGATTTTTSTTLPGGCGADLAGVGCELDLLLAGPLCGAETLDPKLQTFITKKLTAAKTALDRAEAASKPKKRHRALVQIGSLMKAIQKKTAKAVKKQKVSDTCGQAIDAPVGALRTLVGTL